eukprot:CAMPEP_0181178194 /NCGR_PEP_ID=MMETSP1096-20121128/5592_1 /TAXON_ID=156174 ORGANISM="Chrysochromulina ericina, Strain CCMP281" /NCGR_SAMPLE_ID=MMETSP1096 /ASSEMBLY_ACC=CAM_ASM_000453 /LENGTH=131 /DNA_ID=CAMNT_0023266451 /DNA_START=2096 /DNA_END=2491 /DNA_ORIENTATION=-
MTKGGDLLERVAAVCRRAERLDVQHVHVGLQGRRGGQLCAEHPSSRRAVDKLVIIHVQQVGQTLALRAYGHLCDVRRLAVHLSEIVAMRPVVKDRVDERAPRIVGEERCQLRRVLDAQEETLHADYVAVVD